MYICHLTQRDFIRDDHRKLHVYSPLARSRHRWMSSSPPRWEMWSCPRERIAAKKNEETSLHTVIFIFKNIEKTEFRGSFLKLMRVTRREEWCEDGSKISRERENINNSLASQVSREVALYTHALFKNLFKDFNRRRTQTLIYTHSCAKSVSLSLQEKKKVSRFPRRVSITTFNSPKFLRSLSFNWPIIGEIIRFMNSQLTEFQNR